MLLNELIKYFYCFKLLDDDGEAFILKLQINVNFIDFSIKIDKNNIYT